MYLEAEEWSKYRLEIAGGGKDLIWLEMVDHQFHLDTFHFSIFSWAANIVVGQFWYAWVFSYYNRVEFNYSLTHYVYTPYKLNLLCHSFMSLWVINGFTTFWDLFDFMLSFFYVLHNKYSFSCLEVFLIVKNGPYIL